MRVPAAYLAVVLIWSTTPLGIVWSSETVSPTFAVLMRMLIALLLGSIILRSCTIKLPMNKKAIRLYSYSAIGIFGGMLFSYFAASYIGSGLMSLIFGLAPILSGLLAQKLIAEPKFGLIKKFALTIALVGLMIVCFDSLTLSKDSYKGIAFVLIAVFFFSLSGVLVKSVEVKINPIATTVGSLLFSTPLFLFAWFIFDGSLPYQQWQMRSIMAIIYLGVVGSLIGFLSYFYILQKLNASTVALITMITPVLAMTLGATLNDEVVSSNLMFGAFFVVTGLVVFQWGNKIKVASMVKWSKKSI